MRLIHHSILQSPYILPRVPKGDWQRSAVDGFGARRNLRMEMGRASGFTRISTTRNRLACLNHLSNRYQRVVEV